tara:strand:+ start:730 stop:1872 length:1143 start_codon:yes stop_codon:yes gene_type:complete
MGARSSNTDRNGHRNNSQNRLLDGHAAYFYNSDLNAGTIGPNQGPSAFETTGGTVDTSSRSGWTLHKFMDPGPNAFTVNNAEKHAPGLCEVLIVGGGGAAGVHVGAGGGGGGSVLFWNSFPISDGNYPVTVGAAGEGTGPSAPPTNAGFGGKGGDSTVTDGGTTYTAYGGGGGAYGNSDSIPSTMDGGNGGGSSRGGTPGANSDYGEGSQPPQGSFTKSGGNDGGFGFNYGGSFLNGGGGGGANGAGNPSTSNSPAFGEPVPSRQHGGPGAPNTITGNSWFWGGGGGGGGHYVNSTAGNGGQGGGGGGGSNNNAGEGGPAPTGINAGGDGSVSNGGAQGGAGGTNTGGGGGGSGGNNWSGQPGAPGGSGIVIFAYPTPSP